MNFSLIVFLIMAAVAAVLGAIIIGGFLANQPTRSTDATKKPPPAEQPEGVPSGPRTIERTLADLSGKLAALPQNHPDRPDLARMIRQLEAELLDREKRS
jgi:hypothetical protein